VKYQTQGVRISGASCVNIIGNNIHDNVGLTGESHGVYVSNSSHVTMYTNQVQHNGANLVNDSGLTVTGTQSSQVYLYGNNVSNNCGYGIIATNGPNNSMVIANQVRNNGLGTMEGECLPPAKGKYFDLAEQNQGVNINWSPSNLCHTQGPGIPAGVCNPGE